MSYHTHQERFLHYDYDRSDLDTIPTTFATAALVLVVLPPSLFLYVLSLRYARHGIEWARPCYKFFLPAFGLFNLSCIINLLVFCVMGVNLVMAKEYREDDAAILGGIYSYAHIFARFGDAIIDIVVFICLCSLGTGLAIARTGFAGGINVTIRLASYTVAIILGAIATVIMGLFLWTQIALNSDWINDTRFNGVDDMGDEICLASIGCAGSEDKYEMTYERTFLPAMRSNYIFVIFVWVLSMVLLARSIFQLTHTKVERRIQMATRILAACTALWFMRSTFKFGMEANGYPRYLWRNGLGMDSVQNIINVPVSTWSVFGIFALLYMLGKNQTFGLFVPPSVDAAVMQKNLQVNQLDKGFQDIEIPLQPVHTRSGLSTNFQSESGSSTLAPSTQTPPFDAVKDDTIESVAIQPLEQAYEPPRQLQQQLQNAQPAYRFSQGDQDWVRPPSVEPPSHFIPRKPLAGETLPSHEELMGLNHQADGYTPPTPLPYPAEK